MRVEPVDDFTLKALPGVYLAGQVAGVEGYVESAACGLVIGAMLAARESGGDETLPAPSTALGALIGHLRRPAEDFQPSNCVWSMFPEIRDDDSGKVLRKKARKQALSGRALEDLEPWLSSSGAREIRARQCEARPAATQPEAAG